MRKRVAKKVLKRHSQGARYRQTTLDKAAKRMKLSETERRGLRSVCIDVPLLKVPQVKTPVAPQEEATPNTDYTKMSVADLKAEAKSRGLKGYSKMKKAELIDLLG